MQLSFLAPDALKPDPGNARTHSAKQVEQICASIRAFGFTNPILLTPDHSVIAGHGRLLAARKMGLAEVPTIILADLSEMQVRALRLADNRIALNAGWDTDLLKIELQAIVVGDCTSSEVLRQAGFGFSGELASSGVDI